MPFRVGESIGSYRYEDEDPRTTDGVKDIMPGTYLRTEGDRTWAYWDGYRRERYTTRPVFSRNYDLEEVD